MHETKPGEKIDVLPCAREDLHFLLSWNPKYIDAIAIHMNVLLEFKWIFKFFYI